MNNHITFDSIKLISSPEEIDNLKRNEIIRYKCSNKNCSNYNIIIFPGHNRIDRVEKIKTLLCKECMQRESKLNGIHERKNAIFVNDINDIIKLKRDTWFKFKCKYCGNESIVKYQGKSRLQKYSRFLCTKCAFNSTFDINECKIKYKNKTGYDFALQNPEVRSKGQITQRSKNDGLLYVQTDEFKRFMVEQNKLHPEWQEKGFKTQIEKYGDMYLFTDECRDKTKKIMQDKYGVDYYLQSSDYSSKMKEMFGYDRSRPKTYYFSTKKFQEEKQKQNSKGEWIGKSSICFFETEEFKKLQKENLNNLNQKSKNVKIGKYLYEDFVKFDSAWELVLWIYAIDHNEEIIREPIRLEYEHCGKTHYYYPDFKYKGKLIEIKGPQYFLDHDPSKRMIFPYNKIHSNSPLLTPKEKQCMDDLYEAKHQCGLKHGVEFWSKKEMIPYMKYIDSKYGSSYITQFKIK